MKETNIRYDILHLPAQKGIHFDCLSLNQLDHPVISLFYLLTEKVIYHNSLDGVMAYRAFYSNIESTCEEFLSEIGNIEAQELIEQVILHIQVNTKTKSRNLKPLHPEGYDLLDLNDPIDHAILRDRYYTAAKRHHPDVGGSNEKMRVINEAYELFHHAISAGYLHDDKSSTDINPILNPSCLKEYLCGIHSKMLHIYLDDWNVDKAKYHLDQLISLKTWKGGMEYKVDKIGQYLIMAACANGKAEVKIYTDFVKNQRPIRKINIYYMQAVKGILKNGYSDYIAWKARITHIRQAENLLKYNLIGREKYNIYLHRHHLEETEEKGKECALLEYLRTKGFINPLPSDIPHASFGNKQPSSHYIPQSPHYLHYHEGIEPGQSQEYFWVFNVSPTLDLVRKYKSLRLSSILRSAILFYDDLPKHGISLDDLISECAIIRNIQYKSSRFDKKCISAIELLEAIKSLKPNIRKKKLIQLKNLHERQPYRHGNVENILSTVITLGGGVKHQQSVPSINEFAVEPYERYCEIALKFIRNE